MLSIESQSKDWQNVNIVRNKICMNKSSLGIYTLKLIEFEDQRKIKERLFNIKLEHTFYIIKLKCW